MPRPTKNNADYFSHDTDMRNDRRIRSLRKAYGSAGYGVYCMLLETLTDNDLIQIEMTDVEMKLIADDFDMSVTDLEKILQSMAEIDLIQFGSGTLRCRTLDKRLKPIFDKRRTQLSTLRGETVDIRPSNTPETPIVKKRKVKDKKEEQKQEAYFVNFYSVYPRKVGKAQAIKAWNKIKPDEKLFDVIMVALNIHIKHWDDPRYIPHPATWINQRRWEDVLTTTIKTPEEATNEDKQSCSVCLKRFDAPMTEYLKWGGMCPKCRNENEVTDGS
jgi:hypothetical protein